MITVPRKTPLVNAMENPTGPSRLELLRAKINSEDYLYEAIQRMAQVLSNEILGIPQGGTFYERQRKGRK
ncbi:hypothetical protein [Treponema primitia]|uniref:hypothetical protein n=1 Tax=Treponema primitia TaxID=88058 RepID=UPI0005A29BA4|nr:hypothetical protein [Treponema primitia]